MAKRYLLSTGKATTKIEEYVLDLFRLNLVIYPKDIPHYWDLGFDFLLSGVTLGGLESAVKSKIERLIEKVKSSLSDSSVTISISTLDLIDEETVKLVIDVSGVKSEDIYINLYPE